MNEGQGAEAHGIRVEETIGQRVQQGQSSLPPLGRSGFRVQGLGFGVFGLRVWGLGLRVWGLGFRVWGLRLRVWGFLGVERLGLSE